MWPRAIEAMLGLWLLVSPFVFGHVGDTTLLVVDLAFGLGVFCVSCLAFWGPAHRAHLVTLAAGLALAAVGYFGHGHPSPPGYQNLILVGLTLALFAIIPSEATQPPRSWRQYYEDKARRAGELRPR